MDTTSFDPATSMPEQGRGAYVADTVIASVPEHGKVFTVVVAGATHQQFDTVARQHAATTARGMDWPAARLIERTLRADNLVATFVYAYVPEETLLRAPAATYPAPGVTSAPEGALSDAYDGVYLAELIDVDQIPDGCDLCEDCGRAIVKGNEQAARAQYVGEDADRGSIYLHKHCWRARTVNWGRPWTLPNGPLTWHLGKDVPGADPSGPVPTTADGVTVICVDGEPVLRFDLRTGTIGIRPSGPRHTDPQQITGWHDIPAAFDPPTRILTEEPPRLRLVEDTDAEIITLPGVDGGTDRG